MNLRSHTTRIAATTAIGVLALTVTSLGVATAANGGSLVLGHSNKATKTTTLSNKKGTPLSLVGKTSKPPLKVNSSKEVIHLNANLLDGQSAPSLATAGSGVQIPYHSVPALGTDVSTDDTKATLEMSTATLGAGTYYLSGSVNGYDIAGPVGCFLGTDANLADAIQAAFLGTTGSINFSLIGVKTITVPTVISEYCYGQQSTVNFGGLYAIKVATNVPGSIPVSDE